MKKRTSIKCTQALRPAYFFVPVGVQGDAKEQDHLHCYSDQDPKPKTLFNSNRNFLLEIILTMKLA
jgi:hypothetical protein